MAMLARVLETEVMDTAEEANDYDAMDHASVNRAFCMDLVAALPKGVATPKRSGRSVSPCRATSMCRDGCNPWL